MTKIVEPNLGGRAPRTSRARRNAHLNLAGVATLQQAARELAQSAKTEPQDPAVRLRVIAGHEQILRALQGRDPDASRAAMKEHLENAQKWAEDAAAAHAEDARPGDAAPRESGSTQSFSWGVNRDDDVVKIRVAQ